VIDGLLAVSTLSLDHVVASGVVFERHERFHCEPDTIALGAL
jgi:hypothetical protein